MGSSESSGGSGGGAGGGWGQTAGASWGQTAAGPSWGQSSAAQHNACHAAQSHADAACAGVGNSDLSGTRAGIDMINQGARCSAAQDAANKACK
jgi:hypothetical protein